LLNSLRGLPHVLRTGHGGPLDFLYAECAVTPELQCAHPTCAAGRWLYGPGLVWIQALTGRALRPPADGRVLATLYTKGCYLAPHNDYDGTRAVAFVLGLSPHPWPAEQGGHLEFLRASLQIRWPRRRPSYT
jgi:hypothetical protein